MVALEAAVNDSGAVFAIEHRGWHVNVGKEKATGPVQVAATVEVPSDIEVKSGVQRGWMCREIGCGDDCSPCA